MMTTSRFIVQPDWAGKAVEVEIEGRPVIERFEPAEKDFEAGLADLSHRPKAVLYGPALKQYGDRQPGEVLWTGQGFLGAVKPGEGVLFDLLSPGDLALPFEGTDMTDAWVLFGLWGPKAVAVLQRLFNVDLERPSLKEPFYLITRWHALTVQILNLKKPEPGFLLATDRSHGQNLYDGLIHGGRHLGLRPTGLKLWEEWFNNP